MPQGPPAYENEHRTKNLLVAYGRFHHYYKLPDKFPALFGQKCGHFIIFDVTPRFLAEPIMMFYSNLVGKHCLRQWAVQAIKDILQIMHCDNVL
jgi:hypothetical protein